MATRAEHVHAEEPVPEDKDAASSANSSPPRSYQFDFLNWFYWSLWWQQYSYNWAIYQQQQNMMGYTNTNLLSSASGNIGTGPPQTDDSGTGMSPDQELDGSTDTNNNQQEQQQQPVQQPNAWGQPQQWNWNLPQFGVPFQFPGTRIGQVYLRFTAGYETFIAPFWRRCAAELIDTVLFSFLLKFYQPDIDLRVPEIVFKGSDVWIQMDEDEILDVKDMLTWFLISSIMERLFHAVLETVCLILFSCTPGKWLMGLRVWSCSTAHLTRTTPGYSVRVHPGGRLSPILAFFRSLFKAAVSLFIPMVVFFFHMNSGRTKYDELFGSIVVDTHSLMRPIYSTTSGAGGYGNNLNQYAVDMNNDMNMPPNQAAAINRPQFRVG